MTEWCLTQDLVKEGAEEGVTRLSRTMDVEKGAGTVVVGDFKKTCQALYEVRAGVESPEDLARLVEEEGFCTRCGASGGHKTFCRVPDEPEELVSAEAVKA